MKKYPVKIILLFFLFYLWGTFSLNNISSVHGPVEINEVPFLMPPAMSLEDVQVNFKFSVYFMVFIDIHRIRERPFLAATAIIDVNCYPLFNHNKYSVFGRSAFV